MREAIVAAALDGVRPASVRPAYVGRLSRLRGGSMTAQNVPAAIGDCVLIGARPDCALGEIIGFDGSDAVIVPLVGHSSKRAGDRVMVVGSSLRAEVGRALIGRVVDGLGRQLDGKGTLPKMTNRDIRGEAGNPLHRQAITHPLATGVRAIDALATLGRGQRMILIAGSGVGKSSLIQQMMLGTAADVVVVALIGERSREISEFAAFFADVANTRDAVLVAAAGDTTPLMRVRAVQRATTIAEHFGAEGRHVLLIVDSLTRVAHAQRELGLALGETPTVKGYPASALAIVPALLERCGNIRSCGSVTALYTVLADGDDADDPVVDAARAIADGHILLSRRMAAQGIFPAIDISQSLSRVMGHVTSSAHRAAAARVRRLWAIAEENRDLQLMGAYAAGADADVDEALAARAPILEFLRQDRGEIADFDATLARLALEFTDA